MTDDDTLSSSVARPSEVSDPETTEVVVHPDGVAHERRLLEDLKQSAGHLRGRQAIEVRLSRLLPENRTLRTLKEVESLFAPLFSRQGIYFYWLRRCDFLLTFHSSATLEVRSALVKLRFLLAQDPVIDKTSDRGGSDDLVVWHDMMREKDTLIAMATDLVSEHDAEEPVSSAQASETPATRTWGEPLTPAVLARVEQVLMGADLSSYVRRQPVCVVGEHRAPDPVFTEVFVSIADLREAVIPSVDLASNRWLFQHLTQTLDRRVLALLTRRDDRSLYQGFSVNLNVNTLLSEEFLRFEDSLAPGSHGTVVLEIRAEDIYSNLNAWFFARDFVHQRGYRLCIDGLTWDVLPYVDPAKLGADMMKLVWQENLPDILSRNDEAMAVLRQRSRERLILSRCDSDRAISFGRDNGITLFQGRLLDQVLRGNG